MTNLKEIGKILGELDVKRFHLPGIVIKSNCPKCKAEHTWNGKTDYIGQPVFGNKVTNDIYFCCDNCDADWQLQIVLQLTVSIAE